MSPEQRKAFFSECGKNCVEGGVLPIYKKLYDEVEGDMDAFFQKVNDLPGVKSEIVKKDCVYHLVFLKCTCGLCRQDYVTTPLLCECSRQSVLYSLQNLWGERHFSVTLCHSILQGEQDCKIKIETM